jgi:hypothetical protein
MNGRHSCWTLSRDHPLVQDIRPALPWLYARRTLVLVVKYQQQQQQYSSTTRIRTRLGPLPPAAAATTWDSWRIVLCSKAEAAAIDPPNHDVDSLAAAHQHER